MSGTKSSYLFLRSQQLSKLTSQLQETYGYGESTKVCEEVIGDISLLDGVSEANRELLAFYERHPTAAAQVMPAVFIPTQTYQ